MTQREAQDADGTRWTFVQAYAGPSGDDEAADEAARRTASADGKVDVVATPSGGAQTVRLALPPAWADEMDDDDLLQAVRRGGAGV